MSAGGRVGRDNPVNAADTADIVVVGAGTAGCAAAMTAAAGGARVVVVDAGPREAVTRVGESLPGAAGPLLATLGLPNLATAGHESCHVRFSRWGSDTVSAADSIFDPDGPGWTLDRPGFEMQLRGAAARSGALLRYDTAVAGAAHDGDRWRLTLRDGDELRASVLVVATGRVPAGRWIERRRGTDRQLSYWTVLTDLPGQQAPGSYVESTPDGWWYTTPLPRGGRLLAFHTDPDIGRRLDVAGRMFHLAASTPGLNAQLRNSAGSGRVRAARAGSATPAAADVTLVPVGDASLAFDPIAGQGLFHALCTGVTGGQAAVSLLAGNPAPRIEHDRAIDRVWRTYRARRRDTYAVERRWPEAPYWQRRHAES